jgi:hypothetical protein
MPPGTLTIVRNLESSMLKTLAIGNLLLTPLYGDVAPEPDKLGSYIAHRFHKFGLKPGGDNGTYLQNTLSSRMGTMSTLPA